MAAPRKTAGALNFERQLDEAFPHRQKPDGWIADSAHGISGHQPDDVAGSKAEWNGDPDNIPDVRALDLALDLGEPGVSFQDLIDHLVRLPKLATVIRYLIYAGKIYHERAGFAPAKYNGADQHFGHGHVSFAWSEAADDNTSYDYHLEDLVGLTADDKSWLTNLVRTEVNQVAAEVWAYGLEDPTSKTTPRAKKSAGAYQRYADVIANGVVERVTEEIEDLDAKQ